MLQTVHLTVGYVAGFIAAAIFAVRILAPTILTFILSSILRDTNTAATWTVAARALERSQWPTFLSSDSTKNHGVRKDVVLLTWFISLMGALIAVAGVVTPLGLYETTISIDSISMPFQYIKDTSPFGYGTPDRSNLSFSRICGTMFASIPCPFTDTLMLVEDASNGSQKIRYPYGYDINVPSTLKKRFSSGTGNSTTVSNFFDLQWRRWQTTTDADGNNPKNNGSRYLVGAFRLMQPMILDDSLKTVEGLIVDMVTGGIGLRNHTIPPLTDFPFGVSWEEDITFIEPETVCVDTNTTLDYTIAPSPNSTTTVIDLVLTDRGGFVNLNHTFPRYNRTIPQVDPDLAGRAYKAAWLMNAYTMIYYNVTAMTNETLHTKAFSYLNSYVGKTFQLPIYSKSSYYNTLGLDTNFYYHLNFYGSTKNVTSPADSGGAKNPFNLTVSDFMDISLSCRGAGGADNANITNTLVTCGIMRGVPRRKDQGSSIQFDSGSQWSQPLYACASAIKATIKTVSFTYNGTNGLQDLHITGIKDKKYEKPAEEPLWGVEYTGNYYSNAELSLIWGLISPQYENHPNVSSLRNPSLYLPGYALSSSGGARSSLDSMGSQNLPASDFFAGSLSETYIVGSSNDQKFDYSGGNNMAMWVRWQNLTNSSSTAGQIPNLIWTDFAAAAVVGTKGVLGAGNMAGANVAPIAVTPTVSRIQYHWPFGIPALLVLLCLVLMAAASVLTLLFGHGSVAKMRLNLQRLSPGRILSGFLYPEHGAMAIGSKEWSKRVGKTIIDMSGDFPMAAGHDVGYGSGSALGIPLEKRSGASNGVYERAPSGSVEILDQGIGYHGGGKVMMGLDR